MLTPRRPPEPVLGPICLLSFVGIGLAWIAIGPTGTHSLRFTEKVTVADKGCALTTSERRQGGQVSTSQGPLLWTDLRKALK